MSRHCPRCYNELDQSSPKREWLDDVCVECKADLADWLLALNAPDYRLVCPKEIARLCEELAKSIEMKRDVTWKHVVFLPILNAGFMFGADLLRAYARIRPSYKKITTQLHFLRAKSYHGSEQSGEIVVDLNDVDEALAGVNKATTLFVLVDTIYDSGKTYTAVLREFCEKMHISNEGDVFGAVLLRKECEVQVQPANLMYGRSVPDVFLIGYGTDFNGKQRDLPSVWATRPKN